MLPWESSNLMCVRDPGWFRTVLRAYLIEEPQRELWFKVMTCGLFRTIESHPEEGMKIGHSVRFSRIQTTVGKFPGDEVGDRENGPGMTETLLKKLMCQEERIKFTNIKCQWALQWTVTMSPIFLEAQVSSWLENFFLDLWDGKYRLGVRVLWDEEYWCLLSRPGGGYSPGAFVGLAVGGVDQMGESTCSTQEELLALLLPSTRAPNSHLIPLPKTWAATSLSLL